MGDGSPTTQVPNRSRETKHYGTITSYNPGSQFKHRRAAANVNRNCNDFRLVSSPMIWLGFKTR